MTSASSGLLNQPTSKPKKDQAKTLYKDICCQKNHDSLIFNRANIDTLATRVNTITQYQKE